jgi:hypothetical protein
LWRWLQRALEQGLVKRSGRGYKSDPYRYCLPEQEERWRREPFYLPPLEDVLGCTLPEPLQRAKERRKPRGKA